MATRRRRRRAQQADEPTMMQQWLPYMMMQQLQSQLRAPLIREGRQSDALQRRITREHQIDQAETRRAWEEDQTVDQRKFILDQEAENAMRRAFERDEQRHDLLTDRTEQRKYQEGITASDREYEEGITRDDRTWRHTEQLRREGVQNTRQQELFSRADQDRDMGILDQIYDNAFNAVSPALMDNPAELDAHWEKVRAAANQLVAGKDYADEALKLFQAKMDVQGTSPEIRAIVTQAMQQIPGQSITADDTLITVLNRVGAGIGLPNLGENSQLLVEHEVAQEAYEQSGLPDELKDHPAAGWAGQAQRDDHPPSVSAGPSGIRLDEGSPRLTGEPSAPDLGKVTEAVLGQARPMVEDELGLAVDQEQAAINQAGQLNQINQNAEPVIGWIIDDQGQAVFPQGTRRYENLPGEGRRAGAQAWLPPEWDSLAGIPEDRIKDINLMDANTYRMLEASRTPSTSTKGVNELLMQDLRRTTGNPIFPEDAAPDPAESFNPEFNSLFTRTWGEEPPATEDTYTTPLILRNYVADYMDRPNPVGNMMTQLINQRNWMLQHEGPEGGNAWAIADAFQSNREGMQATGRDFGGWTEGLLDRHVEELGNIPQDTPWEALTDDQKRLMATAEDVLNTTQTALHTADLLPAGELQPGVPSSRMPRVPMLGILPQDDGTRYLNAPVEMGDTQIGFAGGQRVPGWNVIDRSLVEEIIANQGEIPPFNQMTASSELATGEEKNLPDIEPFVGPSESGVPFQAPGTFSPGMSGGEVTEEMMERAFGNLIYPPPPHPMADQGFMNKGQINKGAPAIGEMMRTLTDHPVGSGKLTQTHIPDQTMGGRASFPPTQDKGEMPTWGTRSGNLENWFTGRGRFGGRGNITATDPNLSPAIVNPTDAAFEKSALGNRVSPYGGPVQRPSRQSTNERPWDINYQPPELVGQESSASPEQQNILRQLTGGQKPVTAGVPASFGGGTTQRKTEVAAPLPTSRGIPEMAQPDSAMSPIPDIVSETFPGAEGPTAEALSALLTSLGDTETSASMTEAERSAATSPKGAQGKFQFMPETAAEYGIDPRDPNEAAKTAARMLLNLFGQKQTGDPAAYGAKYGIASVRDALAGYNWGPGNLDTYGKLGNRPEETQKHIERTMGRLTPEQEQLINEYIENIIRQGGDYTRARLN